MVAESCGSVGSGSRCVIIPLFHQLDPGAGARLVLVPVQSVQLQLLLLYIHALHFAGGGMLGVDGFSSGHGSPAPNS